MGETPINPMVQQALNFQGGGVRNYGAMSGQPQTQGSYIRPLNGLGNYMQPGQYPFSTGYSSSGQMPPRFGGPPIGSPGWRAMQTGGQGGQFPFQFPGMPSLGNFYTPHGMGDAQNVPNQGQMANFIGNQWQNSQWGQTPGNSGQPGGGQYFNGQYSSLPMGGYRGPTRGY